MATTTPLPLFGPRRPHGIVVTDAYGNQYVARLGSNVSLVDGVLEATGGGAGGGCDLLTCITAAGVGDFVFTGGDYICCEDPS
jgi:hypothetical protein